MSWWKRKYEVYGSRFVQHDSTTPLRVRYECSVLSHVDSARSLRLVLPWLARKGGYVAKRNDADKDVAEVSHPSRRDDYEGRTICF
jgi:hypothetical protein